MQWLRREARIKCETEPYAGKWWELRLLIIQEQLQRVLANGRMLP